MNGLQAYAWPISESAVERLGWVLMHSLWQLSLMALLAAAAVRALRRSSAAARYGVLAAALAVSVAAPVATWLIQSDALRSRGTEHSDIEVQPKRGPTLPADNSKEAGVAEIAILTPNRPPSIGASELRPEEPPSIRTIVQPTPTWSERAAAALQPWLAWIVASWCFGIVVFSSRPLLGWHMLRRLRRIGVSPVPDEVLAALERMSGRLGVRRAVRVVRSTLTQAPVVVGYLRPMILLPVSLVANIPAAQLEAILAHELAHVRRHDFLINVLQIFVETTFFYHPAVWWLSRQIRVEREHCCDDLVVALLSDPVEYGRALVAIEQMRGQSTVLALGAADGSLLSRVRRILGVRSDGNAVSLRNRGPEALFGIALIGLTFAVTMNWSLATNDDKTTDPPKDEANQARPKDDPVPVPDQKPDKVTIRGRVLDANGKAVPGADVAVIGQIDGARGYPRPSPRPSFVDGKADNEGRFRFELPERTSEYTEVSVAAISVGSALCTRRLDIDSWQAEIELRLQADDVWCGHLFDLQGIPVAGARVEVSDRWNTAVLSDSPNGSDALSGFAYGLYSKYWNPERKLERWRVSGSTDAQGQFVLHGLKAGWRVAIKVIDERFGPHEFIVAPAKDNGNKEFVGVLAPKRILEGTVTSAETGKPVPNAELQISTSSDRSPGFDPTNSVEGRADERGRFSLALPAGKEIDITACAPAGSPFLTLGKSMTWPSSGALKQEMNLALPTGVIVRGTVTETPSGKPVPGAKVTFSPNYSPEGSVEARVSDAHGKFEIAVLPGRGHLLINGPTSDFLHREMTYENIDGSGGYPRIREYYDAVVPLNLKPKTAPDEISAVLRRGVTLHGSVVGPEGQPVREGIMLCRSYLEEGTDWSPTHTKRISNGRFSLPGCDPERVSEVFFIDEKRCWGGIAKLSGKDAAKPASVQLERCGSAKVRFIDEKGNPIPKIDAWTNFVITPGANIFSSMRDAMDSATAKSPLIAETACAPYSTCRGDTDSEGRITFTCLIPGATYQLGGQSAMTGGAMSFGSDFRVAPGQVLDLGDIQVKARKR